MASPMMSCVMAPLRKALRFWLDNLPFGEAADEGDRQLASTLAAYVRRYEACPETFVGELAEYDSRLNHSILFGEDLSDPNKRGERIVSLLGLGEAENARERRIITCMVPPARAPGDDMARKEALFLKRARRFAKNDGEIDEKEQAQLEKLAEELGIPRLRMEELIKDAFDD